MCRGLEVNIVKDIWFRGEMKMTFRKRIKTLEEMIKYWCKGLDCKLGMLRFAILNGRIW